MPAPSIPGDYLTPTGAALQLGVSTSRVRQMLAANQLAHIVTPLGRLISAAAVARLQEARAAAHGQCGEDGSPAAES